MSKTTRKKLLHTGKISKKIRMSKTQSEKIHHVIKYKKRIILYLQSVDKIDNVKKLLGKNPSCQKNKKKNNFVPVKYREKNQNVEKLIEKYPSCQKNKKKIVSSWKSVENNHDVKNLLWKNFACKKLQ